MARSLPTVADGVLRLPGGPAGGAVAVGSPPWFAWLADPATRSFAFQGSSGTLTARKEERRRGTAYWSAYRSIGGRVRKTYLGTGDALTLDRLEDAAATLAAVTGTPTPASPAPAPAPPALDALLQTKLFIPPPRRDLVDRDRLCDLLTAGLRGKLTIITGPAGSGKTTLLSAWHAGQQGPAIPLAWVSLDEADNDPMRFWRYLCTALNAVAPGVAATALGLLGAARAPVAGDLLIPALVNTLVALPHDLILVLDDYHVIGELAIHGGLALLLDRLPPQVHLVIASRAEPPLPLARLRARGELVEVRAGDLRFTPAEVAGLLNDRLGLALSPDLIATLAERTEGWAVGLHLAALALRRQEPAARAAFLETFGGSHRYIGDYLLQEVLADQPPATQSFLLRTAILDRLCGPLCDAVAPPVAGGPGGGAMLASLERAGLFLVPLDEERHWYRYHRLFAELLRGRLRQEVPVLIPDLHRRASAWFAAEGLLGEAIEHAIAAGEPSLAADLIERAARPATIRSEHRTVARWLAALPPAIVAERPRLGLAQAWSLVLQREAHEAVGHLARLEADPRYAPHAGEVATLWTIHLILRDIAGCIAYGEKALALLPPDDIFLRSSASVGLGMAYWLSGNLAAAERVFAATIALNEPIVAGLVATSPGGRIPPDRASAIVPMLTAQQTLGDVRKIQGRLHEAGRYFERAVALVGGPDGPLLPIFGAGHAAAHLAYLLYEWDRLDEATQMLDLALTPVQEAVAGNSVWSIILYEAYLAGGRGDRAGVHDALRRASEFTEGLGQPLAMIITAIFRLRNVLIGDERAEIARETAALHEVLARFGFAGGGEGPPPRYPTYIWVQQEIALGWADLVGGRAAESLRRAEVVARVAEVAGHRGYVIPALALAALARAAGGDEPGALDALGRSLALAAPEGYVRTFVEFGEPMCALLRAFVGRARVGRAGATDAALLSYASRLLTAFALPDRGASPARDGASPATPEPLSAREREILTMLADGLGNADIAAHLFIAPGTVKWHVNGIFGKLGVTSRTGAVARARALGLLA